MFKMNRSLLQKIALPLFLLLFSSPLMSQNVGINETGANPDASAMLDINTSNKGLLIPRLSRAQKSLIASPANGLLVYQTDDTMGFWYYEQNKWVPVMRSITAGKGLTGGFIQGKELAHIGKFCYGRNQAFCGDQRQQSAPIPCK